MDNYPSFDESARQFQQFLSREKWPANVIWIRPEDAVWTKGQLAVRLGRATIGEAHAREIYRRGVMTRLGVSLEAVCRDSERTFARVLRPVDEDASSRLMFPDGLKLSVPVEPPPARMVTNPLVWWGCLARGAQLEPKGDVEA